jgi:hypothetical protein
MINHEQLKIGKNAFGDELWVCGHCGKPADHAKGAQNREQLVYMLMCPEGKVTLGEWTTLEEKNAELKAHGDRLKAGKK